MIHGYNFMFVAGDTITLFITYVQNPTEEVEE